MLQSESDYLTLEGRYVLLIKPERVLPRLVLISLAFIRFPCVIVSLRSYYFFYLHSQPALVLSSGIKTLK